MKKLRLDDIQVDSYATHAALPARGTVEANAATRLCPTATPQCQQTLDVPSCISAPWCC